MPSSFVWRPVASATRRPKLREIYRVWHSRSEDPGDDVLRKVREACFRSAGVTCGGDETEDCAHALARAGKDTALSFEGHLGRCRARVVVMSRGFSNTGRYSVSRVAILTSLVAGLVISEESAVPTAILRRARFPRPLTSGMSLVTVSRVAPLSRASMSCASSRASRVARSPRVAPHAPATLRPKVIPGRRRAPTSGVVTSAVDPDAVDPPGSRPPARDDYATWKSAKDNETEAFKRAAAAAGGRADDFVVGAKPLDEGLLSRLMLQLLQNHSRGIPASALLNKVKDDMCLDGYKSVLVGVGRTRQWALAREIVEWVRAQGVEQGEKKSEVLTSNWFVALARRRVDEREWEAAVEVLEYMRDLRGVPSGETIELFATITDREDEMNALTVSRCRRVGEWLAGSDAGKALWHLSFGTPGMKIPEMRPAKTVRIALPSEEFDINGDIDQLREQFKEYLE